MKMRALLTGTLAACASLVTMTAAAADVWPTKAVRIIVGYPPGGPVDNITRLIGQGLSKELGHPIVIDNKAGASGMIGIQQAVQAEPDGYTFGIGVLGALAIAPLVSTVPFKPEEVNYVTLLTQSPHVLAINPTPQIKDIKSFVEAARKAPGKLNYGSTGTGSSTHLDGELLADEAKIDVVHVPYKGGAPLMTALLTGEIQLLAAEISAVLPMKDKLKIVAVMGNRRSPALPDVPTTAELGYPNVIASSIYGLIAPAKTPAAITDKMRAAVAKVLNSPEVKSKLAAQGQTVTPSTGEEYRKLMESEGVKWSKLIKAKNIKLD